MARSVAGWVAEVGITSVLLAVPAVGAALLPLGIPPGVSRAIDDAHLRECICQIHAESRGTYGAPRVEKELRARGARSRGRRLGRGALTNTLRMVVHAPDC